MHVKMGPGVLGITGTVCAIALIAIGVVVYSLSDVPDTLVLLVLVIVAFTIIFLAGSWTIALFRPEVAVLSGAELVKHEELQVAAKDRGIVIDQSPTTRGAALTTPQDHDDA